jgi:hypothetical protein
VRPLLALGPHALDRRHPAECRDRRAGLPFGDGSFIPAGRVETLPADLRELARGRLSRRLHYLSRPLVPDLAAFPLGGISAPFCLASPLSATDGVFPIQQPPFLVSRSMRDRRGGGPKLSAQLYWIANLARNFEGRAGRT